MLKSLYNWSISIVFEGHSHRSNSSQGRISPKRILPLEKRAVFAVPISQVRTESFSDCPSITQPESIRDQVQTQVCLTSNPSSFQNPLLWPTVSKWAKEMAWGAFWCSCDTFHCDWEIDSHLIQEQCSDFLVWFVLATLPGHAYYAPQGFSDLCL